MENDTTIETESAIENTSADENDQPVLEESIQPDSVEEEYGTVRAALEKQISVLAELREVADRFDAAQYDKKKPLFDDAKIIRECVQMVKKPIHEIRSLVLECRNEKFEKMNEGNEEELIAKLKIQQERATEKLELAMKKIEEKNKETCSEEHTSEQDASNDDISE